MVVMNNNLETLFCKPQTSSLSYASGSAYHKCDFSRRLFSCRRVIAGLFLGNDLDAGYSGRDFLFVLVKDVRLKLDDLELIDLLCHRCTNGQFIAYSDGEYKFDRLGEP